VLAHVADPVELCDGCCNLDSEVDGIRELWGSDVWRQAILWASNLLHGGAPQADRSRSRHSQVTHVFFEGCRYYTPMLSDSERTHWRDPTWIA
jgi:hypothetical protein